MHAIRHSIQYFKNAIIVQMFIVFSFPVHVNKLSASKSSDYPHGSQSGCHLGIIENETGGKTPILPTISGKSCPEI
jgi:hypothetical protein